MLIIYLYQWIYKTNKIKKLKKNTQQLQAAKGDIFQFQVHVVSTDRKMVPSILKNRSRVKSYQTKLKRITDCKEPADKR